MDAMRRYPCNIGPLHWSGPFGGWFRPEGQLGVVNDDGRLFGLDATRRWTSADTLSARIIVGFNVGDRPRWSIDDLIPLVQEIRMEQTGDPSASFLAQRGIYQHSDPRRGVVTEDSAQIIIIDTHGLSEGVFEEQMIELAGDIAERLKQEEVIVEIQRNGVTQRVHGIGP